MEGYYVVIVLDKEENDRLGSLCGRLSLRDRDVIATALRTLERELDERDAEKKRWEESYHPRLGWGCIDVVG